ncbi:unnamed protein product [Owenia fusiformis]|uniref:DAZ-associated protein 2 n=1 Tax=Owenia fusiformis TaxID=6347 RepID=A0A8S4N2K0_OWEFU|nr:unnamed protein product [Owenia fusiformis]
MSGNKGYSREAPPPYSAVPQQAQYVPPPGNAQAQYGAPPTQYKANETVVVKGVFDAGARFGPGSGASIPPPPPGVKPNAAQMAQSQGANVVATQKPQKKWEGGSDGGYCLM